MSANKASFCLSAHGEGVGGSASTSAAGVFPALCSKQVAESAAQRREEKDDTSDLEFQLERVHSRLSKLHHQVNEIRSQKTGSDRPTSASSVVSTGSISGSQQGSSRERTGRSPVQGGGVFIALFRGTISLFPAPPIGVPSEYTSPPFPSSTCHFSLPSSFVFLPLLFSCLFEHGALSLSSCCQFIPKPPLLSTLYR